MENIFVEFLPPWVETGLQPAFYDKESGSVLQQTARMYARVNMLIRMFNKLSKQTKETVEEYIEKFTELSTYVHDYFDNLDVQEEINNKLDAMVEAGTLQEIIAEYIQANVAWCFDTVADMKLAENFINGSYAQTLGYHAKNDGGSALYKIRTVTNDDVVDESFIIALADNTLVAELIVGDNIIPEQLGAYGDGTHDDTTIIHRAMNYSDSSFKCIKATKKYKLTSTFNVENLTNSYINIDGETPTHTYAQSVSGEYGYNIGGSFILDDMPLLSGTKTKGVRGAIRNLTIIPVTKDSSVSLFYQVHFFGFRLDNLSIFYFKYIFNNCNTRNISALTNSHIMYLETLVQDGNFTESLIKDNYINGISTRNSSCFNAQLPGTKIENNFIDYFAYIYNDQTNNRVQADFISTGNTYDFFGTLFGLKSDGTSLLNAIGINSSQDTFSNWTGDKAIVLTQYNMDLKIKTPKVKPNSARRTFIYCELLNATDATYLDIDTAKASFNSSNQPVIDITWYTTGQAGRRISIADLDYIAVDAMPTRGFVGQHVIYNGELYCYVASGSWKQLSNAA